MIKTKDNLNISELGIIYYIDEYKYEIIKIDLNLEKRKSIYDEFHEIGKYESYDTSIRCCTKFLLQYLNNTLEKHNNLNKQRHVYNIGTKSTTEFIKIAASYFYGNLENVENQKKYLINKFFKEHVKVKDLINYLSKFNKEDLIHFYNSDPEYGSYFKNINIQDISKEIIISSNLFEKVNN